MRSATNETQLCFIDNLEPDENGCYQIGVEHVRASTCANLVQIIPGEAAGTAENLHVGGNSRSTCLYELN